MADSSSCVPRQAWPQILEDEDESRERDQHGDEHKYRPSLVQAGHQNGRTGIVQHTQDDPPIECNLVRSLLLLDVIDKGTSGACDGRSRAFRSCRKALNLYDREDNSGILLIDSGRGANGAWQGGYLLDAVLEQIARGK